MSRFMGEKGIIGKNAILFPATLLLLLMFGLAVYSLAQNSPTFDEQGFITRGLGYLRGENRHMRVGHPLGLNALNALFLVGDDRVKLPTDHPSWQLPNFHRPSELFLWEIGNNVAQVMFLARLPTVFLAMLLAAFTGRWAWEMAAQGTAVQGTAAQGAVSKKAAGIVALLLIALDPNILAHAGLATTDLGLAAGALLAGYLLWRYFRKPSWGRALLAGVAFGLLQNTKFTAGLFVPLLALVILAGLLAHLRQGGRGGWPAVFKEVFLPLLVAYPAAAFLTLWAAYGFEIGTLPNALPTFSQLGGRTLPLAHHLEQLLDIGGRIQKTTPSFLLGQYSDQGWWYYFPIAFLVKTPLPVLLLLLWAIILRIKKQAPGRKNRLEGGGELLNIAALLIPAGGYFAIALTSNINLGYRHLLPVLPFLAVFISTTVVPAVLRFSSRPTARYVLAALAGWLLVRTLLISPHFLAYFNEAAGGPENGWRILVDSNLDWGQDLQNLKEWLDERGGTPIWLSYFGEARPDYYGINYIGLESNPPRLMNPLARPYYPFNPAPGIYAISATTLQGVHFENHDLFAWFREREPIARIGYSIFIYEVPGQSVTLAAVALGNIQLDEIEPADFERLGTNRIIPRWFDSSQAMPVMYTGDKFIILPNDMTFPEPLAGLADEIYRPFLDGQSADIYIDPSGIQSPAYRVFDQEVIPWQTIPDAVFTQEAGRIVFRGFYLADNSTGETGETLVVLTVSEQQAEPAPVKMFIHLTGPDDQIAAQWDGLGIVWESWLSGDYLVQQHQLSLPETMAPGAYHLWAGFYNPDTFGRWLFEEDGQPADRLLLQILHFS